MTRLSKADRIRVVNSVGLFMASLPPEMRNKRVALGMARIKARSISTTDARAQMAVEGRG